MLVSGLENFDRLVHAAQSDTCLTPQYIACVPASIIKLVQTTYETDSIVELPIQDPDHFVEIKKYLHIAAYSIDRTALVYPIFGTRKELIGLRLTVTAKRWKDSNE